MSSTPPITKKDVFLTTKGELLKAMQVANSIEGAQYLRDLVRYIVANSKYINSTEELRAVGEEVVKAVDEFAKFMEFKFTASNDPWNGEAPQSSFANMQAGIAKEALAKLDQTSYRFDFAISADGHFIRGYASGEKGAAALDPDTVEAFDRLFNAWLAQPPNNVTTENGYFIVDGRKLSAEEVEAIMANSAEGFTLYIQEQGNIALTSRHREYPGEKRLEQKIKETTEKRIEQAEKRVEQAEKVEVPEVRSDITPGG